LGAENIIALDIPDIKGFMSKLLRETTFDHFEFRNMTIDSFARFEILGRKYPGSGGFPESTETKYTNWSIMRRYAYGIIKGEGTTPRMIKIIFGFSPENNCPGNFDNSIALFINVHFENGKITLTSGQSPRNFSFERQDEEKWDETIMSFLENNGIYYKSEI